MKGGPSLAAPAAAAAAAASAAALPYRFVAAASSRSIIASPVSGCLYTRRRCCCCCCCCCSCYVGPSAARGFTSAAAAATTTTTAAAAGNSAAVLGNRNDSLEDVRVRPKPKKYFDAKTFRQFLARLKQHKLQEEENAARLQYVRDPPEGWGIVEFLNRVGINKEEANSISNYFDSWNAFLCSSAQDWMAIEGLTNAQRRLIIRHIRLFNHGLWPENSYKDYMQRFQAAPLKREGMPWTEEEDKKLLELAEKYDVNFGDPWLYLSWEMQRESEDVHRRYISKVILPQNQQRRSEFVLSKSLKPLFFSRYYKLLPPFLFIVPTKANFNTAPAKPLQIPPVFRCL